MSPERSLLPTRECRPCGGGGAAAAKGLSQARHRAWGCAGLSGWL